MRLVEYSSSSSEDEKEIEDRSPKRRRISESTADGVHDTKGVLPALPDAFRDLYAVAPRISTSDDASLHQGRKRATPHTEGNWPTHVYLEWIPSDVDRASLQRLVDDSGGVASVKSNSLLVSDIGTPLPLHISLSAPLVVKTEERRNFLSEVQNALRTTLETKNGTKGPLQLSLGTLKWAANFERSRWFLAAGVQQPDDDALNKMLKACNRVAASKELPTLYAKNAEQNVDPQSDTVTNYSDRFHFSLAWTLNPPIASDSVQRALDVTPEQREKLAHLRIEVKSVKVKIGSSIHNIEW